MTEKGPPENAPAPGVPAASSKISRFSWRWFILGKRVVAVLARIPLLVIGTWIVVGVFELTFQRHTLDIDAIGVPEPLSKAGFTSDVATERLCAGIFAVQDLAQTIMAKTAVVTEQELSAITIPKSGLTLQGIGATLRGLIPSWQTRITGEFIQSGGQLSLQIRLNGHEIFQKNGRGDSRPRRRRCPDRAGCGKRCLQHRGEGSAIYCRIRALRRRQERRLGCGRQSRRRHYRPIST